MKRWYRPLVGVVVFTAAMVPIMRLYASRNEMAGVSGPGARYRTPVIVPPPHSQGGSQGASDPVATVAVIPDQMATGIVAPSILDDMRKWVAGHEVLSREDEGEFLATYSNIAMAPEIVAYAVELASNVNAVQRRLGFLLLQRASSLSPDAREVVVQSLTTEQDPHVLSEAIRASRPGALSPDDSAAVLVPLRYLLQHSDAAVRAESVQMLAHWETPAMTEMAVYEALMDPAREVRLAAVTAVTESGLNSERLKSALLNVARNPNEPLAVKANALSALRANFSFTRDETASYDRSRKEVATLPKGSDFVP